MRKSAQNAPGESQTQAVEKQASRRLDQFWKERFNALAARNDYLALAE